MPVVPSRSDVCQSEGKCLFSKRRNNTIFSQPGHIHESPTKSSESLKQADDCFVPLIISEQNQRVLGFCQVLWFAFQTPEAVGISWHPTPTLRFIAANGCSRGWASLCPKVWWGQQASVLGKEDFLEDHCTFWMTLPIFLRTILEQEQFAHCLYGCSSETQNLFLSSPGIVYFKNIFHL